VQSAALSENSSLGLIVDSGSEAWEKAAVWEPHCQMYIEPVALGGLQAWDVYRSGSFNSKL